MKKINLKSAAISAMIIWTLGVLAFVGSYFVQIIDDPEKQANWILSVALIPAASLGAHIYYRKGFKTNGFLLGACLFLMAAVLDALITVPFILMPYGETYSSFFLNTDFWLIGVELISVVAAYWQIERAVEKTRQRKGHSLVETNR